MDFQAQLDNIEAKTDPKNWPLIRQVYLDLVLAKMWKIVEPIPIAALENTVVFAAHEPDTPSNERLVILPIYQETSLSSARISELFNTLAAADLTNDGDQLRKITLAIHSPDSTLVYYHIYKGFNSKNK
ncbi:tRNA intron endonuclease [Zychaea mexicana]|uniref:tRNA intron endonuclease n=1 Tax=Zychaea mexicana TaxID=64656 RepID=UPI0022FE1655|nr:tRNA intron endonuclease [Zychaea mexicana]KAI9494721.1 tRNA intron endonuclease [Zychaea mexicana]